MYVCVSYFKGSGVVTCAHSHIWRSALCYTRPSSSSDACFYLSPLCAVECSHGSAASWRAPSLCHPQQLFLLLLQPGPTTLQCLLTCRLQTQGRPAFHTAQAPVALLPPSTDETSNHLVHIVIEHSSSAQQLRGKATHPGPLWRWRNAFFCSEGTFCCAEPGTVDCGEPATETGCNQSQERRFKHWPSQRKCFSSGHK